MNHIQAMPTEYLLPLLSLLEEQGVKEHDLFEALGFNVRELNHKSIKLNELESLIETALILSGNADLGIRLGKSLNISTHGYLGYIAMASPDIKTAITQTFLYQEIRTQAVVMHFEESKNNSQIILSTDIQDGQLYRYFAEVAIYVCLDAIRFCLGGNTKGFKFEFSYNKPDYVESYLEAFPGKITFNADQTRIIFPSKTLSFPIPSSDTLLTVLIEEQCKSLLLKVQQEDSLSNRIREILINSRDGFPSQERIAESLNMTTRTLRNRLSKDGEKFREILDNVRLELAQKYLANSDLKIDQIAYLLDYNEPTHFIRAFKRWKGITPSTYRKQKYLEASS